MILLSLGGLVLIYSATYTIEKPFSSFFIKQSFGILTGICIYFVCLIPDYRTLMRVGYTMYFCIIALLLFTLVKGTIGMGAKRWINLIFFKLQPSELAKLFFPAFMINYLHLQKKTGLYSLSLFFPILCMLGLSFFLIRKQPDLGTALIILFSGLILCWLAGLNKQFFIYSIAASIIIAPAFWYIGLKDYQKNRIIVFFGQGDKKKERYQIEQATIAIGSGGMWGKGLFNGTQNRLRFLPESRTDFIFAVLCEECGLCGALTIFIIYCIMLAHALLLIKKLNDVYAQLLASGLLMHILLTTIINIGMVLSIFPIVGIPLPLMSYGLSNLWTTFICLGLFQNIIMHCHQ